MIVKIEGQPTENYWYDKNVEEISLKNDKAKSWIIV